MVPVLVPHINGIENPGSGSKFFPRKNTESYGIL
jgi:hypothetical protein